MKLAQSRECPQVGVSGPSAAGVRFADRERRKVVMGWTPPDCIDVQ